MHHNWNAGTRIKHTWAVPKQLERYFDVIYQTVTAAYEIRNATTIRKAYDGISQAAILV
jgi:hypothetical protein